MNIKKKMVCVTLSLILILTLFPGESAQAASGNFVTPKYQDTFSTWFRTYSEGYYIFRITPTMDSDDYAVGIYDQKMKRVAVVNNYDYGEGFHDGLMAVGKEPHLADIDPYADSTDYTYMPKYGYVDTSGKLVIPCEYYDVSNFKNGLAVVHKLEGTKVTTLIINKKNQVQFKAEGNIRAIIGDNYIYIDDGSREPGYNEDGYNEDVPDSGYMKWPGTFYDYKWNKISIASRKGTFDKYGYWALNGDRIDGEGYSQSERDAFTAKYGKLYHETEYLGKGFFKVKENPPAGTDEYDYDVMDNLRTAIVNKVNKTIVPFGNYSELFGSDTETSKFFVATRGGDTDKVTLYSGTGKKVLGEGTFTDCGYMGGGGIYYAKMSNKGWGMITLDGKQIAPYSKKLLSFIDYYSGYVSSFHHYQNPPKSNITFYTTANMNEKADTTNLKSLVAKAKVISKKYKNSRLTAALAQANSVIASKNPRWLEVSMVEIELLDAANMATIAYR